MTGVQTCALPISSNMRYELEKHKLELTIPIRIEKWDQNGRETTWLHIDTNNYKNNNIYFFKA